MKIKGRFVMRQIAGEWLAIPVNDTALHFSGMVILNPTSRVIWECLQTETDIDSIVYAITQHFDVSTEEAKKDALAFIEHMRSEQLIID